MDRETSLANWQNTLVHSPFLRNLAGFFKTPIPSIGTYYNFIRRLCPISTPSTALLQYKKPKPRDKQGHETHRPHPGIVAKLVNRLINQPNNPATSNPEYFLNLLLKLLCVNTSAQKGLLGNLKALSIAGDGSKLKTGASHLGVKICTCKSKGIYRCDCPRRLSDPAASWGWDNQDETYVYGRTLYEINAADSPYDLPLFIKLTSCQRSDSVTSVVALAQSINLYPEFNFSIFSGDCAHDNYSFYRLLDHFQIKGVIPLNLTNKDKSWYQGQFEVHANGQVLCPAKLPMIDGGFNPDRQRRKWRCPLKAASKKMKKSLLGKCPTPCSPSQYGRVFYTKTKEDPRLFPKISRASDKWQKEFAKRTSVERSHKRKKRDYKLEYVKVRSTRQWLVRVILAAICQHLDAWFQDETSSQLAAFYFRPAA